MIRAKVIKFNKSSNMGMKRKEKDSTNIFEVNRAGLGRRCEISCAWQLRAWGYTNLRKRTLELKVGTTLGEKFHYFAEYTGAVYKGKEKF